jgi:hypothetical protein
MRRSCRDAYDVVLLYDNFHDDFIAPPDIDVDVHLVNRDSVAALEYPSWPGRDALDYTSPSGLRPGNWDFAILDCFRARPHYAHYWRVEYDVRFTGDWGDFFDRCSASPADLLGTTILRHSQSPPWFWWSSLGCPHGRPEPHKMIRGFFPVARLSRRACVLLDERYRAGWYGHAEAVMPTLLAHHGLAIEDIGGTGEFVPAGHENRFYENTPQDDCLQPGTFVFRPALDEPGTRPNTLWHPVRDEGDRERWLRKLARRGSTTAQFQVGVICAKGESGTVDLCEAYFWHTLAASGGHEFATRWRDEIAVLLSAAERAAADNRVRQWSPEPLAARTTRP